MAPQVDPSPATAPETEVIPRLWDDLPVPAQEGNLRELEIAQQLAQTMVATAERQRIGGNRFHGKLHIVIHFQDGVAQRVQGFPEFNNR